MAETKNQSDVVPGTVFTERQVGILKKVVVAMGVLLVGGFVLVIAVIIYQASTSGDSAVQESAAPAPVTALSPQGALRVPKGMTISHMALDDNRLAVHLTGADGEKNMIIDHGTGVGVSTISINSE